ncbi:transcription factor domain-containing protein [Aspergillus mulundensis]|uniref:Zn(2)-C6 fungal-type domain-containing protein n=1 Tax=Aspergillus mulundensis TaxID=1810919 RepID=A0A3D8SUE5_9EURO|nr:hypothetical protein DSM5745_01717 [Aspergillus mulundensis]RDW89942.1 hypothetical protein DSM5745_01717 [Aspergillus mulundensis]
MLRSYSPLEKRGIQTDVILAEQLYTFMASLAKERYAENIRQRSGTVPGYDRLCREFHGNVAVTLIDFAHTGYGRLSKLTEGPMLRDPHHLAQWLDGGLQDISTRYVLIEDIDTNLWFTLGGIFGIEPQFFLDHMNSFDVSACDSNQCVQWTTWNLPLPYLSFRWYRPVSHAKHSKAATRRRGAIDGYKLVRREEHYEKGEKGKPELFYTIHGARALSSVRRPEWDLSASSSIAAKGLLAIEERVSIYRTMRKGYRYIIMLLDAVPKAQTATWTEEAGNIQQTFYYPPLSATIEEVDLYKGLIPRFPPNFNTASIADVRKEYLENIYNTHYSTMMCLEQNSDPYNQVSTPTPVPCGHLPLIHLFQFVESDTLGLLHLLDRVQKDIVQSTASQDAELEDILAMRKFIASALAHLSTLSRDLTDSLGELLTLCRGSRKDPQHETVDKLSQHFEDTIQGLKEASNAITGTLQFIESHRAILETESITRLTELAFLFIPLSFAASLFSMQIQQLSNPVPVSHFIAFALSLSATTYALRAMARNQVAEQATEPKEVEEAEEAYVDRSFGMLPGSIARIGKDLQGYISIAWIVEPRTPDSEPRAPNPEGYLNRYFDLNLLSSTHYFSIFVIEMSSRRRNGQAASCEPCRKDKVRCDHELPVCGRCQKRNRANQCYYHPAPLTGDRASPARLLGTGRISRSARNPGRKASRAASPTPSSVGITIRSPGTDQSQPPGYFGPTSFVSAFAVNTESAPTPSSNDSQVSGNRHSILPSYWVSEITKMLRILTEGPIIEQLVYAFYGVTQSAVLPTAIAFSFMTEIRGYIKENETPQTLHEKTTQILESTAQRLQVPSDVKGNNFHKLFSGNQMRLEIIGIIYAIAGRASFFGFLLDKFPVSTGTAYTDRIKFSRMMLTASETAVQVCRMLTPVSDLTTWMLYENWLLSCMFHGDSSSPTWNRLGELSSCIFELGLHRDCNNHKIQGIPTFLRELRRRLYAGLYYNDKNVATFFGRPPRVSWRHSDCKPPLDISDEALLGDEQDLEQAVRELDDEGWNADTTFRRASWYRIRYFLISFREEILELSLRPVDNEAAGRLRHISTRCTEIWNSAPAHLRYTTCNWDDDLHIGVRIMIIATYLVYLYSMFLIQRLLIQHDSSAERALLDVCSEILSLVLLLERQQGPAIDIRSDLNSIMVLYGFSSASTLIKALQTQARTGNPIPYSGSRAELIRNLSVFISHIEAMARPITSNINHSLFERASKMFTNILDEVLESRLPVSSTRADAATIDMDMTAPAEEDYISSWAADGMEFLDTLDFNEVFDQWVF